MSFRFRQPSNETDFEEFCERLLQIVLGNKHLQLYGKRGENQDGVDIIDCIGSSPFIAAQCKHHEFTKTLPPGELNEEVERAANSGFELDEYYVLTTAKKSVRTQNRVIKINSERPYGQKFETALWTWPDIERKLSDINEKDQDWIINGGTGRDVYAIEKMLRQLVSERTVGGDQRADNPELQGRFESAEVLIHENKLEFADYELAKIETLQSPEWSSNDHYLFLRLKAKCQMAKGHLPQAARIFLEAFNRQPRLEQAKLNRVIAYDILGDVPKAHEYAMELYADGVRSEPLPSLIYRTSEKPLTEELKSWLEDFLETSEELNIAMAMDLLSDRNYEGLGQAMTRALAINPTSSRVPLIQALGLHSQAVQQGRVADEDLLRQAAEKYQQAIANEVDPLPRQALPDALRNFASAQPLLGEGDPVESFEKATELAVDKGPFCTAYVNYLCSQRRFSDAKRVFSSLGGSVESGHRSFFETVIDYNTDDEADRHELIRQMFTLAVDDKNSRREECMVFAVQWSVETELTEFAKQELERLFDSSDPFVFLVCRSWLHLESGDLDAAQQDASDALEKQTEANDFQLLVLLARIFMRIKKFEQALPLLQKVADPRSLDDGTRSLLDCAMELGKFDVVMETCERLRKYGTADGRVLRLELDLLNRYQPSKAEALLSSLIVESPGDETLYARWCFVVARLHGRIDGLDLARLPKPEGISLENSHLAVFPLIANGHYHDAIAFAYAQLRQNFDQELAHGRYLFLFLRYARLSQLSLHADIVKDQCAVRFSEENGLSQVYVIDSQCKEPMLENEIRPESSIGRMLVDARVGDKIDLAEHSLQSRVITIEEIYSKYVYRFQDVLNHMQLRFPGCSAIQLVNMESEGEFDISPIKKSLEERRKYVESMLDEIRRAPVPISVVAKWLGLSFVEAYSALASVSDIGVRCSTGETTDFVQVAERLSNERFCIVDQSALVTINLLDAWDCLNDFRLGVARSTMEDFKVWERDFIESRGERGTTYLDDDGKFCFREFTSDEIETRKESVRKLVDNIQLRCEILESGTLVGAPRENRELFEEMESIQVLETLHLAAEHEALLLSDDVFSHLSARSEFEGVETFWTQVLLDVLLDIGRIDRDSHAQANAKLVGWNHNVMQWNVEFLLAGCKIAEWDVRRFPLPAFFRQFGNKRMTIKRRCEIATEFFQKMYFSLRSRPDSLLHTSIVFTVLDSIGSPKAPVLILSYARERYLPYSNMIEDLQQHLSLWEQGRING